MEGVMTPLWWMTGGGGNDSIMVDDKWRGAGD